MSRGVGDVLEEAERLVNASVQELLVISQDTSAYGVDIKYRTGFWQGRPVKPSMLGLCEALADLGVWVRLHYVYPYAHVDHVIPLMAEGKILPYLDIPFQHANSRILKLMKRPAATENTLKRMQQWRQICPELTLPSTFIVGFPGETDAEFEELLDFLDEAQLDRVGCFQYSPVTGAGANALPDPVPEEIKQERWERVMVRQQMISTKRLELKVGKQLEVILDSKTDEGYLARSMTDAPEIDGLVSIRNESGLHDSELKIGTRTAVQITDSDEYDLYAECVVQ